MHISHTARIVLWSILSISAVNLSGCNSTSGEISTPVSVPTVASLQTATSSLPACDPNSPDTLFIRDAADWGYINDAGYRIFCVAPGDYSSTGAIRLTSSGTGTQPRVLRILPATYGGTDAHPAQAPEAERAILAELVLQGASYWIIDGLTIRGDINMASSLILVNKQASNNTLNRMLVENANTSLVTITGNGANYNTIQNSVIRKSYPQPGMDHHCITISSEAPNERITGTRIVGNEIYDCTDGIQLTVLSAAQQSYFPDTLIIDNDIYVTPAMYTDCNGAFNPAGECAAAENGIDIKSGATSAADAVIVANNRLWGFRKTDSLLGGSGSSGSAVETCCSNPAYILFSDNIITGAPQGIHLYSGNHLSVVDNLIDNIHANTLSNEGWALAFSGSNQEAYRNIIVGSDYWGILSADNSDYRCNTIINGGEYYASAYNGVTADYNAYYNSVQYAFPGSNDLILNDASDTQYTDRCFWRKQWTGPEQFCIPYGSKPADNQIDANCDPQLGARKNIGVDDSIY
jgi:hypothetical protein